MISCSKHGTQEKTTKQSKRRQKQSKAEQNKTKQNKTKQTMTGMLRPITKTRQHGDVLSPRMPGFVVNTAPGTSVKYDWNQRQKQRNSFT